MWIANFPSGQSISAKQCEWNTLPMFPIVSLMYQLPNGKVLFMSGFEKYYQLKEVYKFVYGKKGQKVWTWNLFGKHKSLVYQFTHFIGKNKKFQIKNLWGNEFRPLKIIPKPAIILPNKKPQKQYNIEFGVPQKTNQSEWHPGVQLKQSIVRIF